MTAPSVGAVLPESAAGPSKSVSSNKEKRRFVLRLWNKARPHPHEPSSVKESPSTPQSSIASSPRKMTVAETNEPIRPHWREDPFQSASDWILQVRIQEESNNDFTHDTIAVTTSSDEISENASIIVLPVELYRIHKAVLETGYGRSTYLSRLFSQASSNSSSACEILLPPLAASTVPLCLDWVYAKAHKQPGDIIHTLVNTQNVCGLYHVSRVLQIIHLQRDVLHFIRNDLCLRNAHVYYQHATRLHEPAILQIIVQLVGRKIRALDWNMVLVDVCPLSFWKDVLPYSACARRMSVFVAIACVREHVGQQLSLEIFQEMTQQQHLPQVDSRVAGTLLRLETELGKTKKVYQEGLTCLQQRCIAALARDWNNVTPETVSFLRAHIPALLLQVLMRNLELASDGLSTIQNENWSNQSVVSSIDGMNKMLLKRGQFEI